MKMKQYTSRGVSTTSEARCIQQSAVMASRQFAAFDVLKAAAARKHPDWDDAQLCRLASAALRRQCKEQYARSHAGLVEWHDAVVDSKRQDATGAEKLRQLFAEMK